jgi:hypothetical protein
LQNNNNNNNNNNNTAKAKATAEISTTTKTRGTHLVKIKSVGPDYPHPVDRVQPEQDY